MSVRIREAGAEDVEGIARVHVQGWRESYAGILSAEALAGLSVKERAAQWGRAFEQPDPAALCLVVEGAGGEIVGFARGGPVRPNGQKELGTEAELYAVYLLDMVKRQGLGRRLTLGVFDHLAARGFGSCGLWVLSRNLPARRFYESLGGIAGVEQTFELRGDSVEETAYRFEPIPHRRARQEGPIA